MGGLFGWDIQNRKATIYDGGETEFEATNVRKIGDAVAAVLSQEHEAATANQNIYVNSFTLTQNQVLAVLEQVSGQKYEVEKDTTAGLRQRSLERLRTDSNDFLAFVGTIVASLYGQGGFNNYSKDVNGGLWNQRLGLTDESLEDTIRSVLEQDERGITQGDSGAV